MWLLRHYDTNAMASKMADSSFYYRTHIHFLDSFYFDILKLRLSIFKLNKWHLFVHVFTSNNLN